MVSPGLCASHAARETLMPALSAAARWGDGSVLFGLDRRRGRAVRSTDSREEGVGNHFHWSLRMCFGVAVPEQRLFLRLGEAERKPGIELPSGGGGAERVEPCVPTSGVEA
jgi:hypothetical protein